MVRVAVLCYAELNGLNGLSYYVKKFKDNEDYFYTKGIQLNICIRGMNENHVDEKEALQSELRYVNSTKYKLKQKVIKVLKKLQLGNRIILKKSGLMPAKEVVDVYDKEITSADVVIINDINTAYYVLKDGLNKKIIYVMHNSGELYGQLFAQYPGMQKGKVYQFLKELEAEIYKKSTALVFVSETAKKKFARKHEDYASKCIYIPVGREDIECKYRHSYDYIHIVTTGTVCRRKNQIALLKAIKKINDPTIKLTVVGGGPELDYCKEYVMAHSLQNVEIAGFANDVVEYLDRANLFVSPSLDEGVPATGVEALRNGLPIIISDVGGCRELIRNNGVLIAPDNQEQLEKAILRVCRDKRALEKMSMESRKLYEERYSLTSMFEKYISLINEIMKDKSL
ncbi:glycosyltransferase family 4 protein [Acetatifactor muris]|uniref:glycosyltransferase family 4 protein n=1 Tax=Acetatifactor muris TaxID=879566 RepID=UPI0023F11F0F|nr:glycosyltransferase family 4 protein [Acetatifactor muris]